MDINELTKELTKEEFIKCLGGIDDSDFHFEYKGHSAGCPHNLDLRDYHNSACDNCKECWLKAIEDIEFKDELNATELTEDEIKIVTNKAQEEYLLKEIQELRDIKSQYECQIAELNAKIKSLEHPVCNCIADPESERERYKSISDENVRLKNIIKLMAKSL